MRISEQNCTIIISDGLPFQQEHIRSLINTCGQNLRLRNLQEVVITSDFAHDVIDYQKRYAQPIGITSDNNGEAFGKTLCIGDGQCIVFINSLIILGVFNQNANEDAKIFGLNLIRHELAHVQDNLENLAAHNESATSSFLHDPFILWCEYYADYLSGTLWVDFDYKIQAVIDVLLQNNARITHVINSAIKCSDSMQIFRKVQPIILRLAIYLSYSLGLLDSMHDINITNQFLENRLSNYFDTGIVIDFHHELNKLLNTYPFAGIEAVQPLAYRLYDFYRYWGVRVAIGKEGMRFDLL